MRRATPIFIASLAILAGTPIVALAANVPATFFASHTLLVASSSPGNAYAAGLSLTLAVPTRGDFSCIAGSAIVAAPVAGDALALAGTASIRAAVAGDVRAIAGSLSVTAPIAGDLVALAGSADVSSRVGGSVFLIGANATVSGGAAGPVVIYGNNVVLGGEFARDVHIVAAGRVALAPGTRIKGSLIYESPEPALVPADAAITGAVAYSGSSYLPTGSGARALSFASVGVFLLARILAVLILAGLITGLFPRLAEAVTTRAYEGNRRTLALTALLGFAMLVAMPILLAVLSLTFIGLGIALLLLVIYALLVALAFIYAGILLGTLLARRIWRRETVFWRDGVLGMLILSLLPLIPIVGVIALVLLGSFSAGALSILFYHAAFPSDSGTVELL